MNRQINLTMALSMVALAVAVTSAAWVYKVRRMAETCSECVTLLQDVERSRRRCEAKTGFVDREFYFGK